MAAREVQVPGSAVAAERVVGAESVVVAEPVAVMPGSETPLMVSPMFP